MTKIPRIGKPNMVAIGGMTSRDLFEVREYYIVRLVQSFRANDADTLKTACEWISALCGEMRLRGYSADKDAKSVQPWVAG